MSCITAKSNIHKPRRDTATPPINIHAELKLLLTQIDATQTNKQDHCTQSKQRNNVEEKIESVLIIQQLFLNKNM